MKYINILFFILFKWILATPNIQTPCEGRYLELIKQIRNGESKRWTESERDEWQIVNQNCRDYDRLNKSFKRLTKKQSYGDQIEVATQAKISSELLALENSLEQKEQENYTGSKSQNIKLFSVRPDLKGKTFRTRKIAWDEEFNKKILNITRNSRSNNSSIPPRKILFKTGYRYNRYNKSPIISPYEFSFFLLGGYGAYSLIDQGMVVLGKDLAFGMLGGWIYKKIKLNYKNNLDFLESWLEYFPMGDFSPSSEITMGEIGKLEITFNNPSDKTIRNIQPKINFEALSSYVLNNFPPQLKQLEVVGGNRRVNGKYSLGPNEKMTVVYTLTVPSIFDRNSLSLNAGISSKTNQITYKVLDNPDPPELILTDLEFNDNDGNGILDGLETAQITGIIKNKGLGKARGVKIELLKKGSSLQFEQNIINLGDITSAQSKRFEFIIKASKNAIDGEEKIQFYVSDQKGNDTAPKSATIPTAKFLPPILSLSNWTINDGTMGMAEGNGNNIAENGETIEVLLEVINKGEGPAYGSYANISVSKFGAIPLQAKQFIGALGPGASEIIPIGFSLPVTFSRPSFSFNITITDERKVLNFKERVTVETTSRKPVLSFDYSIHDGTSGGSRGNKNGQIEQGEKIELAIIPRNDGELDADDVILNLLCSHPSVTLRGGQFPIGRIPSRRISRELMVPLNISYKAPIGKLELSVILNMANFSSYEETLFLDIGEYVSEDLALGASRSNSGFGGDELRNKNTWINVDVAPITGKKMKNGIAVVIGNRNYENNDIPSVDYAARDSRTFKTYMLNTLGIPKSNIIDLNDANLTDFNRIFGTSENFEGKLYKMVKSIKKGQAKVYVFYSGHGAPSLKGKKTYIVPSLASMGNIEFEGYPIDLLMENLAKLPSKDVTLVMDACFSGNSEKGMLYKEVSPAMLKVKSLDVLKGLNVFSASRNDQVSSWYPKARHGVFTYYFLAGMKGEADTNNNGQITNGEMEAYLEEMVPAKVNELSQFEREQNPTFNGKTNKILVNLK